MAGLTVVLVTVSLAALITYLFTRSFTELNLALAAATTSMPLLVMVKERSEELLHPLFVLAVLMLMGVFGQTILVQYAPSVLRETALFSALTVETLSLGLAVLAGGLACLMLGYLWPRPERGKWSSTRVLQRLADTGLGETSPRKVVWVLLACCIVSVGFTVLFADQTASLSVLELLSSRKRVAALASGDVTSLGYYRLGMSVTSVAFLVAWYTKLRENLAWWSPVALVGALAFGLSVFQSFYLSSRSTIFTPVVWALLLWVAMRGRSPRVRTGLALFVAGLAAAIALQAVRAETSGVVEPGSPAEMATSIGPLVMSGKSMSAGVTAMVVRRVPEAYPYQYGRSFVALLYAPIPRAIWEDKPPVRLGPEIGTPIFDHGTRRRTGAPPGIIGEFYINFGLVGVAVGSVLWGYAIRTINSWRAERGRARGLAALAFAILMAAVVVRLPFSEFTGEAASVLQDTALLGALLLITRRRGIVAGVVTGGRDATGLEGPTRE